MKRLHLFELEDQSWFPDQLRSLVTDLLQYELTTWEVYSPIVSEIKQVMQKMNSNKIIDLCAGGGGQMLSIQKMLTQEDYPVSITLTDKYPNIEAFERTQKVSNNQIGFIAESVDVTNVNADITGFRTLFSSFHHFRPEQAKKILQDAVDKKAAIGVFEFTERTTKNIIQSIILVPFLVLFLTPFVRPFKWSRLFWTYVIPLAPFIVTWDAFVSYLRTYSPEELKEMTSEIKTEGNYSWKIGVAKSSILSGKVDNNIIYLIGQPES